MKKPKTLIIETSGLVGSAAVAEGMQLLAERRFSGPMQHTAQLLPTIERLVAEQGWSPGGIEQVMVSAGPGSFTGIRVAVTTAKTLGYALGCAVVPIPSMEALVLNCDEAAPAAVSRENAAVAVVLEAGRGRIFSAVFRKAADGHPGGLVPGYEVLRGSSPMTPAELLSEFGESLTLMGQGLKYHEAELGPHGDSIIWLEEAYWQPQARNVFRCGLRRAAEGLLAAPDELLPLYLRQPEAVEKWDELHGKQGSG